MLARHLTLGALALAALLLGSATSQAAAQDAQICFDAADKVTDGGQLEDAERQPRMQPASARSRQPRAWCKNISCRKPIST